MIPAPNETRTRAAWLLPLTVLLAGWAMTGWIYAVLERDRRAREAEFMTERIAEAQAAIRMRVTTYVDALLGGTSFYTAAKTMGRDDWRVFAASLQLEKRYPGINGLGVIFHVREDQVDAWRARRLADGEVDPKIMPFPGTTEQPGDPKYAITFLEGNVGERLPIGRNVGTDLSRRRAAELARDTGQPQLHQRLPGSRDMERRSGLLLYVPLYAKGARTETVEERRAASLGWVYAQVFPDVFLDGVLGPMEGVLRLHFFESDEPSRDRLLYASAGAAGGALPAFERVTEMELAGQRFQLGWRRGPRFPPADRSAGLWAVTGLGLSTLVLAGLVVSLQATGRRANAIAAQRTTELAMSEERFRNAFDYAATGMALVALDGRWLRVNAALCDIFGYTETEMLAKTFPEITHPDDVAKDAAMLRDLVAGRVRFYQAEKRCRQRDGRGVWIHLTASLVRERGGAEPRVVAQIEDVTEQKAAAEALRQSEQMFQRLFESSPDAVLLADRSGVIVRANERVGVLFGWTATELVGRPVEELLPLRQPAGRGAHIEDYFRNPPTRPMGGGVALQGRRKDGSEFFTDITLSPVETPDGTQTLAVVRDATSRRQLEENLAQARDAALRASRMKSEFLASMSHEIRTPMNAIIGMTGLLRDTGLTTEQQSMLRIVQGGAESLLALVNDILDLSKIEAGKLRLERAEFELRGLVEETVELLRPRAEEKGLMLATDLGIGPELWVIGDGGRVRQVLTNLVGNAVKFTERGGVTVRVAADETGTLVRFRLTVRDTGVGIPRETQVLLFQPFVQAVLGQPGGAGGTGLGLAISRQLAELMGGEIGFESEVGRGSTFWLEVELPRADGRSAAQRPKPARVLIVEDDEDERELLRHELERGSITVEALADASAALAWLRAKAAAGEPLPLLLIDWHLSGMSGLQLAGAIRGDAALASARLVLMSGGPLANPAVATLAGFEAFLLKPVAREHVERCLRARPGVPVATRAQREEPALKALHVLLAEDNLANQLVARMILTKIGCEVDVVGDGEEALDRLSKFTYDVVLMDCQMPVLDGYEATRRIRAGRVPGVDPKVPIIAVTAYAMREDRAKCLAAGMNDYVTKPVRPAELQAALERCGLRVAGLPVSAPVEPPPAVGDVLETRTIERLRAMPGETGPSLLPELIAQFLGEEPAAMADLATLVKHRDGQALADRAHALGGNAAVLGGLLVRNAALALERSARGADVAEWTGRLGALRAEMARMRAALAQLSTTL